MVDLVPGASIVGEPCKKMVLLVLEASAGHHKPVRRREIYRTVTISASRANCKLAHDMTCCRVYGTGPCAPVPVTISMSPAGTLPIAY